MSVRSIIPTTIRGIVYTLSLLVIAITGAQGQPTARDLRIGILTRQPEVRLQGTVPLRIDDPAAPIDIPAETALILKPKDGGVVALDAGGNTLKTFTGSVCVRANPPKPDVRLRDPDNPPPTPLIKVLGPGHHYDGKPDRPYRGVIEVAGRGDGLTVVNIIDVESYLWGVVSSEMSPGYPPEALKAQAIAARTYALKNLCRCAAQGFDLDDTAACQVYGGYFNEDPRTTAAVNDTCGMVLTYKGNIIDAVYSSTCGGVTESAAKAWGRDVPYLQSVPDYDCTAVGAPKPPANEQDWAAYCKTMRAFQCLQPTFAKPEAYRWIKLLTRKEIEAGLSAQYRVGKLLAIEPIKRGDSGRITSVRLKGTEKTVVIDSELSIRRAFGGLRSSAFTVESYADDNGVPVVFAFWGAGWGHGLGMCQVGAVGMALSGKTAEQILTHYYQGVTIEKR